MRVQVRLRYEDGGRPIALWRHGFDRPDDWDAVGVLSWDQEHYKPLRDTMMVARLHSIDDDKPLLEPLYRAEMRIKNGRVSVFGLSHDELFNKYTAQAWVGELLRDQGPLPK